MIIKINLFLKFLKLLIIFEKKNISINIQYLQFLLNEVNFLKYFFLLYQIEKIILLNQKLSLNI